jgi:hypothetical protein
MACLSLPCPLKKDGGTYRQVRFVEQTRAGVMKLFKFRQRLIVLAIRGSNF